MRIPINRDSSTPMYKQIQDYLRAQILSGELPPGTRLPATRRLAEDLAVSRITVLNAYADLESEGLIGSREGSGSYVLKPMQLLDFPLEEDEISWPLWQQALAVLEEPSTESQPSSTQAPAEDLISFTGVGDPLEFPVKDFNKALKSVLKRDGVEAMEYGDFDGGYAPLRQTIAHVLASQGIRTRPDQVLITSGSQQALSLVCQVLLKPGDVVITEKPTYNLALDLFRNLGLQVVGVPVDADGMQVELLETLLQRHHPKLIYTIPNFQNPSGVCMSRERRSMLVRLARRHNVPVLEDDFVGDLRFEGRALPAIKTLSSVGQVLYAGTFSKMLMPGLRVGYLIAEGPAYDRLLNTKRVTTLTTSTLMQRILHEYVTVGRYQVHLRRSTKLYRRRRDAIMAAVEEHLPQDVHVISPQGGLFIWLQLPEGISSLALLPAALHAGVEYAPGTRFFPVTEEGQRFLRLNFATQTTYRINEGVRRLGSILMQYP